MVVGVASTVSNRGFTLPPWRKQIYEGATSIVSTADLCQGSKKVRVPGFAESKV